METLPPFYFCGKLQCNMGLSSMLTSQRSLPVQLNKMADKTDNEQSEGNLPAKSTPKDALVMGAILKEMGISDYEPRVINQMLEYTYREFSKVLQIFDNLDCNNKSVSWVFYDFCFRLKTQFYVAFST